MAPSLPARAGSEPAPREATFSGGTSAVAWSAVRPAVTAALAVALLATAGCRDSRQVAGPAPTVVDLEPPPVEARASTLLPEAAPTAPTPTSTSTVAAGPGPAAPADAAALGEDLARVEAALRDPATAATELPALGLAQQVGYRQLAANPGWRPDLLREVPPGLHAAVVANTDAQALLASLHKRRPTTLPAWRIVAPPPAASVLAAHQAAGREIGVDWQVLAAIHLVETRMGRIRGTSTAGAKGPMQFLPTTWGQYGAGGDIENLSAASKAAARLLKRNGIDRDPRAAVWSYNHSYAYVDAVLAYAATMQADPRALLGYHGWQVFYAHADGDLLLPEGWTKP